MVKRPFPWLLGTVLIVGAVLVVTQRKGPDAELVNADTPTATPATATSLGGDGAILEDLGRVEGPFDPVITRPAQHPRALPPQNHVVNDPSGEGTDIAQSEVGIWIDGDQVVIGWNDGQGFVDASSVTGYGYSTDRGDTWTDGGALPNGGGSSITGDPTVVKMPSGEWIIGSINTGAGQGTALSRGTFVGNNLNFAPPQIFVDGGSFLDKEWLEYDKITGRLYLVYVRGGIRMVFSDDEGATWSNSVSIGNGHGPWQAVGNDGEVYVSFINPLGSSNADVRIRHSANGGASFSPAVTIATTGPQSGTAPTCFNRNFNLLFPSCDVDRSTGPNRGRVYATWCDGPARKYNILFSYSDDKGQTWTTPVQINDNENFADTEQFWPTMRVSDTDGRVVVSWYDRRNDDGGGAALCDFYSVMSVDGGVTFGPNRRLSDMSVAWCGVPSNIAPNFGDYTDVDIDDRSVFAVWSDARNGGPDVIFSRFDDRHLLTVEGDVGLAPADGDGTAWFMPNETEIDISPAPALDNSGEMVIAGLGLSLMATPAESEGVFAIGGEDLSGSFTMTSTFGSISGNVTVSRTTGNEIAFQFDATSDSGLDGIGLLPRWTGDYTLTDAGTGQVAVSGNVSVARFIGNLVFSLTGTISLDGDAGASLGAAQGFDHSGSFATGGGSLVLHTRTLVTDDVMIAVGEPAVLGPNAYPLFKVGSSPNPYQPSTRVSYDIDRDIEGALRLYNSSGQLVRTIVEGRFEAGTASFAFDGKDAQGRDLANGVYFVSLESGYGRTNKKMFMVR